MTRLGGQVQGRVALVVCPVDFQTGQFDQLTGDGHVARHGRVDQTGLDWSVNFKLIT